MVHLRYNSKALNNAVSFYKKQLGFLKKRQMVLIELQFKNEQAFFSLAPLGRAIHELGADANVFVLDRQGKMLECLKKTWRIFDELEEGKNATAALKEFIGSVQAKTNLQSQSLFSLLSWEECYFS